jgi:ferredoxin--NADP+ reductase
VGGGFGIAAIHPIARDLTLAGNQAISILGARTKELLLLEEEMRKVCAEVRVATDDGSYGTKGKVTDLLEAMIENGETIDRVVAVGPLVMMRAVAELTRPHRIKTVVSMNPIMVDGTGMCGACRVMVDGKMKFACVDGPEFDGHQVDFETLMNRMKTYQPEETQAREKFLHEPECRLEATINSTQNTPGRVRP